MKKKKKTFSNSINLSKFTMILTIGSLIFTIGSFTFKNIAIYLIPGQDYIIYSLSIQTFQLMINFSTFHQHLIFTKDLVFNEYNAIKIKVKYMFSYSITSTFGFCISFLILKFLNDLPLADSLILSSCLIFNSIIEYFTAIYRSKNKYLKSSLINISIGLLRIIFGILLFIIKKSNYKFFLYTYTLSFGITSFLLVCINLGSIKEIKIAMKNNALNVSESYKNLKNALLITLHGIINSLVFWLIAYIGTRAKILNPLIFKYLDLSNMLISLISLFGFNFAITIISTKNIEEKTRELNLFLFYLFIISLIFSLSIILLNLLLNIEGIVLNLLNIDNSIIGKRLLFIAYIIPIPIILMQALNGKLQLANSYKEITFTAFFSVILASPIMIIGIVKDIPECLVIFIFVYYFLKFGFFYIILKNIIIKKNKETC